MGRFKDFKQEDWDKAYHQLLASVVGLINGFLPGMKQQRWGRIISITSMAVKQPINSLILSNSVRASVVGLIKTLANELGRYNITVNNVMPGYMETERLKLLIEKNPSFASPKNEIPVGRFESRKGLLPPLHLASGEAAYSGFSLAVDGGWTKGMF